jgi:hypothetical protein
MSDDTVKIQTWGGFKVPQKCIKRGQFWAVTPHPVFYGQGVITHIGSGRKIDVPFTRSQALSMIPKLDQWLPYSRQRDVLRAAKKLSPERKKLIGAP